MNHLFPQQSDHPLFRYFTEEERDRVEALGKEIRVAEGEYLIRQNEMDSRLFAIEDGHLEIVVKHDQEEKVLASVGPGDVLGEVSFIDDSPRSVWVRAADDAVVRAWPKKTLSEALKKDPELLSKFAVAMSELLVERLRDGVRRQGAFRPA